MKQVKTAKISMDVKGDGSEHEGRIGQGKDGFRGRGEEDKRVV